MITDSKIWDGVLTSHLLASGISFDDRQRETPVRRERQRLCRPCDSLVDAHRVKPLGRTSKLSKFKCDICNPPKLIVGMSARKHRSAGLRPQSRVANRETLTLFAFFKLFQQRPLMQDRAKQGTVYFDMPVVADKPELAKLVHEVADPGSRGPDHFRQGCLTDVRTDRLRAALLAEIREQQEQPCKSPLARIEELVDEVLFNPAVPESGDKP